MVQTVTAQVNHRRARRGKEARRRQIIEAAALFARNGLRGTTTREISRAVGMSDPSPFKHFATKDDLYAAVIEATSRGDGLIDVTVVAVERNDDALALRTQCRTMIAGRSHLDAPQSPQRARGPCHRIVRPHAHAPEDFRCRYIAKRIAADPLRQVDPRLAARALATIAA